MSVPDASKHPPERSRGWRRHALPLVVLALLGASLFAIAGPANANVDCSRWTDPTDQQRVSSYGTTIRGGPWNMRRGPSAAAACDRGANSYGGDDVTVYAATGDWAYIHNTDRDDWGWIHRNALARRPGNTGGSPTTSPPVGEVDCSIWTLPTEAQKITPYVATVLGGPWNMRRGPSGDAACDRGANSYGGDRLEVQARAGDWIYVRNIGRNDYGWIASRSITATQPTPPPTQPPPTPPPDDDQGPVCWSAQIQSYSATKVVTGRATIYDAPRERYPACKGNERGTLGVGDVVEVTASGGGYFRLRSGGWIRADLTRNPTQPPVTPPPDDDPPTYPGMAAPRTGVVRSCTDSGKTFSMRISWDANGTGTADWQYRSSHAVLTLDQWSKYSYSDPGAELLLGGESNTGFWSRLGSRSDWGVLDRGWGRGESFGRHRYTDTVDVVIGHAFIVRFEGGGECIVSRFP
ncbi:MAG: GW dipeptide domain-containing protein [Actinomycetota bacterium]